MTGNRSNTFIADILCSMYNICKMHNLSSLEAPPFKYLGNKSISYLYKQQKYCRQIKLLQLKLHSYKPHLTCNEFNVHVGKEIIHSALRRF